MASLSQTERTPLELQTLKVQDVEHFHPESDASNSGQGIGFKLHS
jgi:hypothetical protein